MFPSCFKHVFKWMSAEAMVNQFGDIHGNENPIITNVKVLYMDIKIDGAGNIS